MTLAQEIANLPALLRDLLNRRDGAAKLLSELPKAFPAKDITTKPNLRQWEICGLHFFNQGRFHETIPIFELMYQQLLANQGIHNRHVSKGLPLVWISECHERLGRPVLAKRYLMLTVCEDALAGKGRVEPETTGAYFRVVWRYGVSDEQLLRYAQTIWGLFQKYPAEAWFPEWILQELDQQWMTEYPTEAETSLYFVNPTYIGWLLGQLGKSRDGKALERLAHHLISAMPGCRAHLRQRSQSTDYDVVGVFEGSALDFRSELGRYLVAECKDWAESVGFAAFAKFCRVLDSVKCRFGILFSRNGITGEARNTDAAREQMKLYQDRGIVIVVISEADLRWIAAGGNFITLLRERYEEVRLDLRR